MPDTDGLPVFLTRWFAPWRAELWRLGHPDHLLGHAGFEVEDNYNHTLTLALSYHPNLDPKRPCLPQPDCTLLRFRECVHLRPAKTFSNFCLLPYEDRQAACAQTKRALFRKAARRIHEFVRKGYLPPKNMRVLLELRKALRKTQPWNAPRSVARLTYNAEIE